LDASGGSVKSLPISNCRLSIEFAQPRSTPPFDGVYSSEENMAIESSLRILSITVLELR
jgi:hypothetical protein